MKTTLNNRKCQRRGSSLRFLRGTKSKILVFQFENEEEAKKGKAIADRLELRDFAGVTEKPQIKAYIDAVRAALADAGFQSKKPESMTGLTF